MFCFVVTINNLFFWIIVMNLPIFIKVTSLALMQWYDCPSASVVILKNIGKIYCTNPYHKTLESHTVHTIVLWTNPKQWKIVHISNFMMIIRQSIYIIYSLNHLKGNRSTETHSPTYCIMDNLENIWSASQNASDYWHSSYWHNND